MYKTAVISLFCIAAIIISGCTNAELGVVEDTPTVTITRTPAATTAPTVQRTVPTAVPLYTDTPTKTLTTKAYSGKPLEAPVTLSGFGNGVDRFTTVAPGTVSFKITDKGTGCKYGICGRVVDNCGEDKFTVELAGKSIDTILYSGKAVNSASVTKTFNLISPERYVITVRSCHDWQIVVSNA